jgi:hypothetical protein
MTVWLELHFKLNPEENKFFFGAKGATDPTNIKGSAGYYLGQVLKNNPIILELIKEVKGNTGTHSVRKFAMNIACGNGCTKDDCNHGGRWKGSDYQQDTYSDTTIPFVDAKAATALCRGGAIAYLPHSNSGITDEWLIKHAVPSM